MPDYHVLKKAVDNTSCTIALHLITPSGVNAAGRSWSDLLIDVDGVTTIIPKHKELFFEEHKELTKGRIFEAVINFEFSDPGLTNAQRREEIRVRVAQMKVDIQNADSDLFKERFGPYDWYLYSEDVPNVP